MTFGQSCSLVPSLTHLDICTMSEVFYLLVSEILILSSISSINCLKCPFHPGIALKVSGCDLVRRSPAFVFLYKSKSQD